MSYRRHNGNGDLYATVYRTNWRFSNVFVVCVTFEIKPVPQSKSTQFLIYIYGVRVFYENCRVIAEQSGYRVFRNYAEFRSQYKTRYTIRNRYIFTAIITKVLRRYCNIITIWRSKKKKKKVSMYALRLARTTHRYIIYIRARV